MLSLPMFMYHDSMKILTCSTPGHEAKPQHGKTGLCQACYRRGKREERGLQRPGPKPDASKPYSRYNPGSKHYPGGSIMCGNGHAWEEGSHTVRSDGRKVCLRCVEDRTGDMCPAGVHPRADNMNKYGQCRPCAREKRPERALLYKYHLTPEQFQEMLADQDYACKCCHDPLDLDNWHAIAIDHDHSCCPGEYTCGECVRGILCSACNKGLGCFKDDVANLQAAILYLTEYQVR